MRRSELPVLLVEDDDSVRESMRILLQHRGFDVVTARHGQEALRILDELDGAALIVLDWMMPVMNGRRFLEALERSRFADIPVVVLTAYSWADEPFPERMLKKPVSTDELVAEMTSRCPALAGLISSDGSSPLM